MESGGAFKIDYGDYPASVRIKNTVLRLVFETRWRRFYSSRKINYVHSRLADGTAPIGIRELRREWAGWSNAQKVDFALAAEAARSADAKWIIPFLARTGEPEICARIALCIARQLPKRQAFRLLSRLYKVALFEDKGNILQAIGALKTREARRFLEEKLEAFWSHPVMRTKMLFGNQIAMYCAGCIADLIALGVPAELLASKVRFLLRHPDRFTRQFARMSLPKPPQVRRVRAARV